MHLTIYIYWLALTTYSQGAPSKLAVSLIQNCAGKLESPIHGFLTSCIFDNDASANEFKKLYHEIILKLYQCAPQILVAIIPNLTHELLVCTENHCYIFTLSILASDPVITCVLLAGWSGGYSLKGCSLGWKASCPIWAQLQSEIPYSLCWVLEKIIW